MCETCMSQWDSHIAINNEFSKLIVSKGVWQLKKINVYLISLPKVGYKKYIDPVWRLKSAICLNSSTLMTWAAVLYRSKLLFCDWSIWQSNT